MVNRVMGCAAVLVVLVTAALPVLQTLEADTSHAVRCGPGMAGCGGQEPREEARVERHPCDWVETCRLPCEREGGACCHAEWDCPPPEANVPRC